VVSHMNVDKGGGVWQHQVLFVDGDTPKKKRVTAVAVVISHNLWDLCPLLQ